MHTCPTDCSLGTYACKKIRSMERHLSVTWSRSRDNLRSWILEVYQPTEPGANRSRLLSYSQPAATSAAVSRFMSRLIISNGDCDRWPPRLSSIKRDGTLVRIRAGGAGQLASLPQPHGPSGYNEG